MAEKKGKKKQDTAYRKEVNAEFRKGAENVFTGGGSAAYQPRDADTKKPGHGSAGKRQAEKVTQAHQETFGQKVQKSGNGQLQENQTFSVHKGVDSQKGDTRQRESNHASKAKAKKQMYQTTSGQKVQKSDAKPGQEEKPDFVRESSGFVGQDNFSQPEEMEKKQPDTEDYHRRDTYRQSQKKGKYHKKRVQKEHRVKSETKEKTENKTFTEESFAENTGNLFQGEGGSEFTGSKKLQKKQRQAGKAGKKVQKARAKLPKTREYTLQRVFDEKTGKGKYVVVPLDKEKPFKQEGIPKTTMRRVQNESRNFVHGKIAETEKENSAVEGAHKSEQKGEELFSFVKRQIKGKEQKQRAKVVKLEKKQFKKEVNFQYQKFLEENPQMQKKALQKRLQKQRIKREYIKARKKAASAKTAEQAFEKTKNGAVTVARKLQEFARKNAGLLVTVGIMALLLMMIMVSVSSCGAMFADTQSTILAASYLSKPKEIDAADLQLTRLELDLQKEIDRVETDNPGYDEYSYNLGAIGHNPFTLISYLSAVHTEFTASGVESEIQALFDEMYTLTLTPDTETRTRTVTKTGTRTVTDPVTGEETEEEYEYEEEEEYEVSILRVTLTVIPLESLVSGKMDTEQAEIFAMYGETNGLLQEFASPLNLYWYYYVSSYYGYRKNEVTGNEEFHRGVDIAVPTGTTVYAAHDGTVTAAAYDSHYGNYVAIEIDGYTTKYAHMDSLSVSAGQTVEKGAVIGTTGNTGSSTGSHLHIECLYNGEYYNPLFYFDVGEGTLYGETPGGLPGNAIPPDAYDDASVQALMEEAAKYLGFPYVWGGSSPSTSFDCSGFVCWVFTNSGVHNLPRTTAQGIYDQCTPVSASDAKAGDIIFFTGTYNSAGAVSHVGIYCGNGTMIHCGDPISYASINSPYWQSHFYAFGRLN
ncbi:peptidoglycan DD-metalloendopeptidase family protein [Enterocloster bolteae]|jgi:murein DD-endopeptidase MepM/ murein hydrolase activator NlpD|uniref:CD1108 family mobile element protein n=1 Tax=Clostridia TaxID=186801 RepID=UPI00189D1442|nr:MULTISPECIES: peptidoglycan DD-metalloendopeptidase family protein [Clostridia]MCB7090654.1 peptidoglycan DD-metalloendopeptidase family protein [Enterocloster bolteae]MCH1938563.1 peptidoglycan DD-metalloendopeptidase family protein [Enterocloster sp. OA11]